MPEDPTRPLNGLRVVEVAVGVSAVGAGCAASVPGGLLRDLGADVARLRSGPVSTLDRDVEFARAWDQGKDLVDIDADDHVGCVDAVTSLAREADVVILAGAESLLEQQGIDHRHLAAVNQRLVTARIRPGYDAGGSLADFEILTHARTGLMTQFRGNRPGPLFCDLTMGSVGAGVAAAAGALGLLYEREATGVGGWVETSLYDGLLAILPMIIGSVEHPSATTRLLWEEMGPSAALTYQCADGEYLQLWFGAKGAYEAFLEHIGDPPSEAGYNADTMSSAMDERSRRWAEKFATKERAWWLEDLAGHSFRCEPILRPGEALLDPHVREIGLSVDVDDRDGGRRSVLGPVARVTPASAAGSAHGDAKVPPGPLLSGVRVLDLSAYLAGPVAPQVLAELGADVVKVEPASGDVHRAMEPLFAAGQRGKRSLGLDLKAAEAPHVLQRLFQWADVVHHNSRLGLSGRLGYPEEAVREVNPDVVYSHASGFGSSGPRSPLAANDHLMQALSGMEAAMGGVGAMPTFNSWGTVDVTGGWVSACAILAGLYAKRRTGTGQSVSTTLLGAGMLLKSGVYVADGHVVEGPLVGADQTGYGAAYRIYRGGDDQWFALVVPDGAAWSRLRTAVGANDLPEEPPALRTAGGEPQVEERRLEDVFATRDARVWVEALRSAGVPVEPVLEADRHGFISRLLDDPVNRELGRVASYMWGERGRFEQAAFPMRLGPRRRRAAPEHIASLGEHSREVLSEAGIDDDAQEKLSAAGAVALPERPGSGGTAP